MLFEWPMSELMTDCTTTRIPFFSLQYVLFRFTKGVQGRDNANFTWISRGQLDDVDRTLRTSVSITNANVVRTCTKTRNTFSRRPTARLPIDVWVTSE